MPTQQTDRQQTEQKELTGGQVLTSSIGNELSNPLPKNYKTYRTIRKQPTVTLARRSVISLISAQEWSVESSDKELSLMDEAVELIREQFIPLQTVIKDNCLKGGIDFGWQPFEAIWDLKDNQIVLKKLKPLLQDITTILIDSTTGSFTGFKQEGATFGHDLLLPLEFCFLFALDVEGTQWHGQSWLENIRDSYDKWVDIQKGASRYDKKVAGAHFVVKYPDGVGMYNGIETLNETIAKNILVALEASSSVAVPKTIAKWAEALDLTGDDKEKLGWDISILSDGSPKQYSFNARAYYMDKQLVRGLHFPERAILEGRFGTKAEAGEHADIAFVILDCLHQELLRYVNWYLVNKLLVWNFGEEYENQVWLAGTSMIENNLLFSQDVYKLLLQRQLIGKMEGEAIDRDALRESLGLPSSNAEEPALLNEEESVEDNEQPIQFSWSRSGGNFVEQFGDTTKHLDEKFDLALSHADKGEYSNARSVLNTITQQDNSKVNDSLDERRTLMTRFYLMKERLNKGK